MSNRSRFPNSTIGRHPRTAIRHPIKAMPKVKVKAKVEKVKVKMPPVNLETRFQLEAARDFIHPCPPPESARR